MAQAPRLLEAISSRRRREILRLVWNAERTPGEIAAHFRAMSPSISRSLRALREAGVVRERKVGRQRLYRADRAVLRPVEAFLRQLWGESFDRLEAAVETERRRRR